VSLCHRRTKKDRPSLFIILQFPPVLMVSYLGLDQPFPWEEIVANDANAAHRVRGAKRDHAVLIDARRLAQLLAHAL
jgi:hypothetical protein